MTPEIPKRLIEAIRDFTGREWLLKPVLDWLEDDTRRYFILTGEPGAGKSMVAAWLSGAGPLPEDAEQRSRLERIRAAVKGIHFCEAASGKTAPKALAKAMAAQLQEAVPGFSQALADTLKERLQLTSTQTIGTIATGGKAVGINIEKLDLARVSEEFSFNTLLREPLQELYRVVNPGTIVLIVDALDEAFTYSGSPKIPDLLARLEDLPEKVHFLMTTRHDPRVLKLFEAISKVDLVKYATQDSSGDVRRFAWDELAYLENGPRGRLADRIAGISEGNFLYAFLVLRSLPQHLKENPNPEQFPLPDGLNGVYLNFINRELGMNEARWNSKYGPVLGLIAVGQGDGLRAGQLKRFARKDVAPALRDCEQYLEGDPPDGPFRPFHRSFADFLLDKKTNTHYALDAAAMHTKILTAYCPSLGCGGSWPEWDEYGLRYLATHMAQAAARSENGDGHKYAEWMVRLMADEDFQAYHLSIIDDLAALQNDMELALSTAAADRDPRALAPVVEMALALVKFRRERLRPEPIFELARQGKLDEATRALSAFNLEKRWQTVVMLSLAWLAGAKNPAAAKQLCDRLAAETAAPWPVSLLLERVQANLAGSTPALPWLPEAPNAAVIEDMIKRLAGEVSFSQVLLGFTSEALPPNEMLLEAMGQGTDNAPTYLAQVDGPYLVSFAAALPEEGRNYLDRYLAVFAANDYVYYRNLSLWILLDSILRHPSNAWTQEALAAVTLVAMRGEQLVFRNALPYAFMAWRAKRGEKDAFTRFIKEKDLSLSDVSGLSRDMLATIKRQLAALGEASTLLPAGENLIEQCFDAIQILPGGFSGYHAPAWLTIADSARLCCPSDPALARWALDQALYAAQNIQNDVFCIRTTARVAALRERAWESAKSGYAVLKAIEEFSQNPDLAPYTPLHVVGAAYEGREIGPEKQPLPDAYFQANTLHQIAEVYHQPLAEFERLNAGWSSDDTLEKGARVYVPDPGFVPHLAAHFAAEVMAAGGLISGQRIQVIQSLVPVAASDETALDTVLARLLLATAARTPNKFDLKGLGKMIQDPAKDIIRTSSSYSRARVVPVSQAVKSASAAFFSVSPDYLSAPEKNTTHPPIQPDTDNFPGVTSSSTPDPASGDQDSGSVSGSITGAK